MTWLEDDFQTTSIAKPVYLASSPRRSSEQGVGNERKEMGKCNVRWIWDLFSDLLPKSRKIEERVSTATVMSIQN